MKNVGNQCILNDSGLPALSMDSIGNDDDDGDSLMTIDIHAVHTHHPPIPSDTQVHPCTQSIALHGVAMAISMDIKYLETNGECFCLEYFLIVSSRVHVISLV